ncbi:MAG: hypothetical protein LC799_28250 [Actinobacteria bacterium]|nr:hypothetical protein [Actinomycetota bacterium]
MATFLVVTSVRRESHMPADIAENHEKIEDEYWARRAAEARDRLTSARTR